MMESKHKHLLETAKEYLQTPTINEKTCERRLTNIRYKLRRTKDPRASGLAFSSESERSLISVGLRCAESAKEELVADPEVSQAPT